MIAEILTEARSKMAKAVEVAKNDFSTIRTGQISAAMFAGINVEYYGTPTPLQQLASFQATEARTAVFTPYDKSALGEIEKAIRDSDLGVNPTNDGSIVRVVLPLLTQERRLEYVKLARSKAEDARVSVRSIRRKAKEDIDQLVKDGDIGEDDGNRGEKELEELTKSHTTEIDQLLAGKEAELTEV